MVRRRLRSVVERVGPGVHLGLAARVRLHPAEWGTGVVWVVKEREIPTNWENAQGLSGSTVISAADTEIRTPEHLLAACVGLGLSDVRIQVSGPEVPILDGSALPWCQAMLEAGIEDGPPRPSVGIRLPLDLEHAGGVARVRPNRGLRLEVVVQFEDGPVGTASTELDAEDFVRQVAPARTFVLERDIDRLRAAGLGKGASVDNTVVYRGQHALSATRFADEAVRHKLLDLIGDLAFAPHWPMDAHIVVERGSHALHHHLIRALASQV